MQFVNGSLLAALARLPEISGVEATHWSSVAAVVYRAQVGTREGSPPPLATPLFRHKEKPENRFLIAVADRRAVDLYGNNFTYTVSRQGCFCWGGGASRSMGRDMVLKF